MGRRLGGLAVFVVILAAGAMLGSAFAQYWRSDPGPPAGPAASLGRVRVEVRNAGGRQGMARAATDHLRDIGFDVVFYGNADAFDQASTVVIDRVGRLDKARAVADALGAAEVRSELDDQLYLDVTVLLGSNWEQAPGTAVADTAATPWWDLSRWRRADTADDTDLRNEG